MNDIKITLREVEAILYIPDEEDKTMRLHYPTFREFLTSMRYTKAFHVKELTTHQALTSGYLRILEGERGLRLNIYELLSPGADVADISP